MALRRLIDNNATLCDHLQLAGGISGYLMRRQIRWTRPHDEGAAAVQIARTGRKYPRNALSVEFLVL
jgi:hypothetical protein